MPQPFATTTTTVIHVTKREFPSLAWSKAQASSVWLSAVVGSFVPLPFSDVLVEWMEVECGMNPVKVKWHPTFPFTAQDNSYYVCTYAGYCNIGNGNFLHRKSWIVESLFTK